MFIEINGLAYNLMFAQSIDKLDEDGKYKILYAISNENKLVEEFDNEADRDAKYELAQEASSTAGIKEEIEQIEQDIQHLQEIGFHPLVVEELPEDPEEFILYLVPAEDFEETNIYNEFLYVNNEWEQIGTTSVDLSNYYTKSEVDTSFRKVAGFINLNNNYDTNNPFVLSTLEPGLYIVNTTGFSGKSFTMVAREGDRSTTIFDFDFSRFAYLLIEEKIPAVYDNKRRTVYMVIWGVNQGYYSILDDGYSLTHQWSSSKEFITASSSQTISGKKTFSKLPESSVVPTTDSQLVNKKYVDDNIPDMSNYYNKSVVDDKIPYILDLTETQTNAIPSTSNHMTSYNQEDITRFGKMINDLYQNDGKYNCIIVRFQNRCSLLGWLGVDLRSKPTDIFFHYISSSKGFTKISSFTPNIVVSYTYLYGQWNGDVFNISNEHITWTQECGIHDARIFDSRYAQSSNVLVKTNTTAFTPTSDYNPATKKYVDDNKGQTIQYSTMPTADSTTVGKIVQFTGTTDSTYTNGYFYVGTSTTETVDNEEVTTYSWEQLDVQPAGQVGINKYEINITTDCINTTDSGGRYLNNTDKQSFSNFITWAGNQTTDFYLQINLVNQPTDYTRVPTTEWPGVPSTLSRNFYNVFTMKYSAGTDFSSGWSMPFVLTGYANGTYLKNADRTSRGQAYGSITSVSIYYRPNVAYSQVCVSNDFFGQAVLLQYIDRYALGLNNTIAYTPTQNYHPATKKYVDDAIAAAITDALGGSY